MNIKIIPFLGLIILLMGVAPVQETTTMPKSNTIFLEPFEVFVKKKDLGIQWEPPLYLSSQFVGFKKEEGPKEWNSAWHDKH